MTSISETNTILTIDYVKSSNYLKTENESKVLAEFRTIVREHCDDKDKYFLVDGIPQTPEELGFEPLSNTAPADGYASWMPWWKGEDRRYPTKRG